jgi:hypothetical protein
MRRTYFQSGPLPDRDSSGHLTLSLPVTRFPVAPPQIWFCPSPYTTDMKGVFLKIVFAALVERSYLAASYQNSSSPCFYALICFFIVLCY